MCYRHPLPVIAGLDPAIQATASNRVIVLDARVKPAHDEEGGMLREKGVR